MDGHRLPDRVLVEVIVVVDEDVPHPGDFGPGDVWVDGLCFGRDPARRFAGDLDEAFDRAAKDSIGIEPFAVALAANL